jgi:hypothetical protein
MRADGPRKAKSGREDPKENVGLNVGRKSHDKLNINNYNGLQNHVAERVSDELSVFDVRLRPPPIKDTQQI